MENTGYVLPVKKSTKVQKLDFIIICIIKNEGEYLIEHTKTAFKRIIIVN